MIFYNEMDGKVSGSTAMKIQEKTIFYTAKARPFPPELRLIDDTKNISWMLRLKLQKDGWHQTRFEVVYPSVDKSTRCSVWRRDCDTDAWRSLLMWGLAERADANKIVERRLQMGWLGT